MIDPVQVTFRDMDRYPESEQWVREEAAKLDRFYPKITSCRVIIQMPHRHRAWGNPYQITVELSVPGKDLVVSREPSLHGAEPTHLGRQVVDDQLDAVPAAGCMPAAVRHRPTRGALLPIEQEPQLPAREIGERGRGAREERESEVLGVEGNRGFDVVDHVPDVDHAGTLARVGDSDART